MEHMDVRCDFQCIGRPRRRPMWERRLGAKIATRKANRSYKANP